MGVVHAWIDRITGRLGRAGRWITAGVLGAVLFALSLATRGAGGDGRSLL